MLPFGGCYFLLCFFIAKSFCRSPEKIKLAKALDPHSFVHCILWSLNWFFVRFGLDFAPWLVSMPQQCKEQQRVLVLQLATVKQLDLPLWARNISHSVSYIHQTLTRLDTCFLHHSSTGILSRTLGLFWSLSLSKCSMAWDENITMLVSTYISEPGVFAKCELQKCSFLAVLLLRIWETS